MLSSRSRLLPFDSGTRKDAKSQAPTLLAVRTRNRLMNPNQNDRPAPIIGYRVCNPIWPCEC